LKFKIGEIMEYEFCGTHLIAEGYFLNYDDLNNISLFCREESNFFVGKELYYHK